MIDFNTYGNDYPMDVPFVPLKTRNQTDENR